MDPAAQRPPEPPATFVAPTEALAAATRALDRQGGAVALTGPAGSGKSATAARLVRQLAGRFEEEPLWINCAGLDQRLGTTELATTLLQNLGYEPSSLPAGAERIALLRDALKDKHRLVILDGIDDEEQVRDLIPGPDWNSSLIVTSRSHLGEFDGPQVDVGPLAMGDAVRLLRETAGNPPELEDLALCESLVAIAGGLPFALRVIGFQIASGVSAQDLLPALHSESARRSFVEAEAGPGMLLGPLATSYESLAPQGEALFRLLGLLTADSFTLADLESELGVPHASVEGLEELSRLGLLDREGDGYRLHPLIRRFAREQLGDEGLNPGGTQLAQAHLQQSLLDELRQEVERPRSERGSLSDQVAALEYALRVAANEGDRQAEAQTLGNLGALYFNQGYLDDAVAALSAALPITVEIGDLHGRAQISLALGRVEAERQRTEEAESYLDQSLEAFEAVDNPVGMSWVLLNLGDLRSDLDRLDEAEMAYTRARELNDEVNAVALGRLARLAEDRNDFDRAQDLYESALQATEPESESDRAALIWRSAGLRLRKGKPLEAIDQLEEAFHLFRRAGALQGTAATALTLSCIALIAGHLEGATTWLAEAQPSIGRLEEARVTAIGSFAGYLVATEQGRAAEARPLLEEALSIFREAGDRFGETHALLALGGLLETTGEEEEAATVRGLGRELLEMPGEGDLSPAEALLRMVLP